MCHDFSISDPVRNHIIAVPTTSGSISVDIDVPVFDAAAGLKDADAGLQVSCVRAAWTSLRGSASERKPASRQPLTTESDVLLPDKLLLDTCSRSGQA